MCANVTFNRCDANHFVFAQNNDIKRHLFFFLHSSVLLVTLFSDSIFALYFLPVFIWQKIAPSYIIFGFSLLRLLFFVGWSMCHTKFAKKVSLPLNDSMAKSIA